MTTKRILAFIAILIFFPTSTNTIPVCLFSIPNREMICTENSNDLFEDAVQIIKESEGWHTQKHHPYVGYGHKLTLKDTFNHNISEEFADQLLRKDLQQKCSVFRQFGKDSLLLGVLAYNVGEYTLLGHKDKPTSKLIKKLKSGDRDIYNEYVSVCRYRGKIIPSIQRRRQREYDILYNK